MMMAKIDIGINEKDRKAHGNVIKLLSENYILDEQFDINFRDN